MRWGSVVSVCAAVALELLLSAPSVRAADESGVTGWWLDGTGRAGILIAACGDKICGTVGWMKQPLDPETGQPRLDRKNDDEALRARPICGLKLMWDFVEDGNSPEWQDGKIYDPESGSIYQAHMVLEPDGTLKVRGFIGFSLLGRSQVWTRPATPLAACGG